MMLTVHPANLRDEDELRDDAGVPFATVIGAPWVHDGSVWVKTDLMPVQFPPGSVAVITERTF